MDDNETGRLAMLQDQCGRRIKRIPSAEESHVALGSAAQPKAATICYNHKRVQVQISAGVQQSQLSALKFFGGYFHVRRLCLRPQAAATLRRIYLEVKTDNAQFCRHEP